MKCSKCSYTTFDNYDFCPKCSNDFSLLKKELNLLSFTLTDSNNYLLSKNEPVIKESVEKILQNNKTDNNEKISHNNFKEESTKDEVSAILENFEKSGNSIPKETTESKVEHFEIEDDDISLEDIGLEELLETNREE